MKQSSNKYYEYYKDRLNDNYYNHVKTKYSFLTDAINNSCIKQSILMPMYSVELGCGMSNITKSLMIKNTPFTMFTMIDNCLSMLLMSIKNVGLDYTDNEGSCKIIGQDDYPHKTQFLVRDAVKATVRDSNELKQVVTHSHGLLEHFETPNIVKILGNWSGSKQFHYVPGEKYKTPSIGDERLLSVNAWRDITGMNVEVFNNGYDYLITNT